MEKIRLELIGITYNQIESGVYAVILQQAGGTRRIPIIIGYPEAQAIECKLQDVVTPRPLTHDLMVNALSAFGVELTEVNIRKLPSGIFAATLHLRGAEGERIVDSRSSDAIALAIRVDAPIYTTREVLEESGFEAGGKERTDISASDVKPSRASMRQPRNASKQGNSLEDMTLAQLNQAMQRAAEAEDYEKAARIKREIDRRNSDD